MSNCTPIYQCCNSDIFGYQITNDTETWWNTEQTASCPEGSEGSSVTVPAHTFHSYVSQADADERALEAAENALECLWWNTEQTANCTEGQCGEPVTIEANTVSSPISQADADAKALEDAESQLSCSSGALCTYCAGMGNWPTGASGLPYTNTGNTVSGFTDYLETVSTDGSNLSVYGQMYTTLPIVVDSDFTISMEVYCDYDVARSIGFGLSDADGQQHFAFTLADGDAAYNEVRCFINCTRGGLEENKLYSKQIDPNQLPILTWTKLTFSRVSGVYSFLINDVDTGSTFEGISDIPTGYLCLISDSVTWNIRNISAS